MKTVKKAIVAAMAGVLVSVALSPAETLDAQSWGQTADGVVFPDKEWAKGNPEDFGLSQEVLDRLDELMRESQAVGVLIRNGYLIAEWDYADGAEQTREGIQSCTKSITSMMLGVAIHDGLIPNLDAKVKDYWPDFETGPYTDRITFRHLVTMTSGMATVRWWGLPYINPGNIEPWTEYHYHNDQPVALACALTYLYGKTLQEVIQDKVLKYLDAEMTWGVDTKIGKIKAANGSMVTLNHGLGYSQWTADDLARVGHLYLTNGRWKGKQILPESYVKETFTDIPFKINPWFTGKYKQSEERLKKTGYGLGWWTVRGDDDLKVWYMSGHGRQFCVVLPDYGVVMTKQNDWRPRSDWNNHSVHDYLRIIKDGLELKGSKESEL